MSYDTDKAVQDIVSIIFSDYGRGRDTDRVDNFLYQPDKAVLIEILDSLLEIIYPGYYRDRKQKVYNLKSYLAVRIEEVTYKLTRQIALALRYRPCLETIEDEILQKEAENLAFQFMKKIPAIRLKLQGDLEAAYDGDPAAYSFDEIILAYPGMLAITINRIAHELFLFEIPMIPRIMTEHAHSLTGIDIHPGATLGDHFFIDHGTGIVIGETTVIGNNVKIYQGVTLGALSTRGGQKLKGNRRHPTIEDNVTIYSGASILGGDTIIGHDSVIGGNAFITSSVEPCTTVSMKDPELQFYNGNTQEKK